MTQAIHIIGGGMAGSEAAWQAISLGVPVVIHEMRPTVGTFAHQTGNLAEMVCSNSFRSDDDEQNAVGLLHWEMRAANGLIMEMADRHRLPAGGALAVDRDPFAQSVTDRLRNHPLVSISEEEVTALPEGGPTIIATGPLTSGALAKAIAREAGLLLVADNTLATPVLCRPLELGADIVMHSATKYIGGHSDLLGGLVVARDAALGTRLHWLQNATGGVMGPLESFLCCRGVKTLELRVHAQSATAARLAAWLIRRFRAAGRCRPRRAGGACTARSPPWTCVHVSPCAPGHDGPARFHRVRGDR